MDDPTGQEIRKKSSLYVEVVNPNGVIVPKIGFNGADEESKVSRDRKDNPDSEELVSRYRQGDADAAALLFDRYAVRLTAFARARMSNRLATRIDPEDVMMSAYRSFFIGTREGRFSFPESGRLWRLLVTVTLRKLYRQAARHQADRRDVHREQPQGDSVWFTQALSRDPAPEEVVAVTDLLEDLMSKLGSEQRRVLELRLQGEPTSEIAQSIGKSERTVRRYLEQIRKVFAQPNGVLDLPLTVTESEGTAAGIPSNLEMSPKLRPAIAEDSWHAVSYQYTDYVLEEMIGSGGMGKVYRSRELSTGQPVALKFLRKHLLTSRVAVASFMREANLVSKLQHPGIVPVHGLGRTPWGGVFIVMDLVEGSNLAQEHTNRPISHSAAVEWVIDSAKAVACAHQHGVLHCDLKPGNLMLTTDGRVLVTDFGLSRTIGEQTGDTPIAGTPAFMAPEQVSDCWGQIGRATDVYGLSAILYHLLTGRPPFDGNRAADVMAEVVSGRKPPSPRSLNPAIPAELSDLCLRGLEKPLNRRIASPAELLCELESIGSDLAQATGP